VLGEPRSRPLASRYHESHAVQAVPAKRACSSRSLARSVQLFLGVENLFDVEYDVARTPVRSIGWPITVRAGVRLFLP